MYLLNLTYVKPMDDVEKILPQHLQYLEKYYENGTFIVSGRKNPRTGGVILCHTKNKDEINTILREDPFYREKIAQYEVIEFIPSKSAEAFKSFL